VTGIISPDSREVAHDNEAVSPGKGIDALAVPVGERN